MLLAAFSIYQGFAPTVCLVDDANTPAARMGDVDSVPRPCKTRADCAEGGDPGRDYVCEHQGVMGTTSIGGRVRYRGIFQDPNELAWALSLSLPFAFVWFEKRRGTGRRVFDLIVVGVVLAAVITANVMTQSRSGQISLLATLGVYFIRRFGWRGVAAGAVLAIPILILGGRTDAAAESSTEERLECWAEAFSLWREHPFFGVGTKQFGVHYYLTAHNSALLALAELGPLGLLLFTAVVYLAFKIAIKVQRDLAGQPEAKMAQAAAFATLAGLVGMVASALFLSLAYHMSLWIMIGLAAAIPGIMLRHDPTWEVKWTRRDTIFVVGLDIVLIAGIAIYLRAKGM
jgi:hypothetical protein